MEEDGQENLCVEGSVTCIGKSIVVVNAHIDFYLAFKNNPKISICLLIPLQFGRCMITDFNACIFNIL